MKDIVIEEEEYFLQQIYKLENLQYLIHNNSLSQIMIDKIKKRVPKLNILTEEEYDFNVAKGSIPLF